MSPDGKHATKRLELAHATPAGAELLDDAEPVGACAPVGAAGSNVEGSSGPTTENAAVDGDVVLDVDAVAKLLRIGRNTIYALVARNEVPHRRLGKQIRFSRSAIMRWLGRWSSQGAKEGH